VFFSDIAGFTTISEKLGPTELFYLMSAYLSRMTDILIHHGGTLDKYI
jgi:adenylate cyclase